MHTTKALGVVMPGGHKAHTVFYGGQHFSSLAA